MAEHQPHRSRLERRRLELEEQAKEEAFSTEEPIAQGRPEESVAYHRYVEAQPRDRKDTLRRSGNGVLRQVGQIIGRAGSRLFASQERERRSRAADRSGRSKTSTDASSREVNPKKMKKKRRFKRKLIGLFLLVLIGFVLFASQPFTFLLIGSDARPGESLRGSRSDSLSVMQFVPLSRTIQHVYADFV